jgi:hypothetical protein
MKFVLLCLIALVSMPLPADWAVKGEGNFSCPEYVSEKRINGKKLYSSITWVQGLPPRSFPGWKPTAATTRRTTCQTRPKRWWWN